MADDAAHLPWQFNTRLTAPSAVVTRAVAAVSSRLAGLPALAVDGALAVIVLVGIVTAQISVGTALDGRQPFALALVVVVAGSLAWRRRAPVTAYLAGTVALSVEALWVMDDPLVPYANLIGLYSVGLHASRGRARWGPLIALPGVLAYFANIEAPPTVPASVMFVWLLAWAAGYGGARRRERQEAARRLMRRAAIVDERARMARELHDLIGHTVNVMLMQAGASRMVLDSDPARARELMIGVERTGREALDELDRVLGVLRVDGDPAVLDVQPGLAELPRLAQRLAEAGMRVTVHLDSPARQLPRSLDLSAYRIVQEALTNALRHGRATSAAVTVRCDDTQVELAVRDDGCGPQPGFQPGRGLLGIAERVALFGGRVEYGSVESATKDSDAVEDSGGERGGFQLRAVLPLT